MPGRTWNHPQNQVEMLAAALRDDSLPTLPLPHSAMFEAFRRYNIGHQFVDYPTDSQSLNCRSIFCFTSTSFPPFWDFLRNHIEILRISSPFHDYYCQKSDYPLKIRNFAFRPPRLVPLRVTAAGRSHIRKRILALVFGYLKCGSFRNPVKNNATIDATGMFIPIRLISSLYAWNGFGVFAYRRGVFVACSTGLGTFHSLR